MAGRRTLWIVFETSINTLRSVEKTSAKGRSIKEKEAMVKTVFFLIHESDYDCYDDIPKIVYS